MEKENQRNDKDYSFEDELHTLEQITGKLEQGDIPLKQSLTEFKKGVALTNDLNHHLSSAKTSLAEIVDANGNKKPYRRDKNGQDANESVDANDDSSDNSNGGGSLLNSVARRLGSLEPR